MIKTATQLKDLIRNLSKKKSADAQILMRNYMMERFLERISVSKYRQTFHIQAVTGLMNDPNGFVYFDNKWHLFYQWCPWGAVHGLKYWYHVVSKDLITWENLGVCLIPDDMVMEGTLPKGFFIFFRCVGLQLPDHTL